MPSAEDSEEFRWLQETIKLHVQQPHVNIYYGIDVAFQRELLPQ